MICEICQEQTGLARRKTCSVTCRKERKRRYDAEIRKLGTYNQTRPTGTEKHCPRCRKTKPIREWGRNKAFKDGLQSYCRLCRSSYAQRADQQRKNAARKRQWQSKNRTRIIARARARYYGDWENEVQIRRDYYARNRDQILLKRREEYRARVEMLRVGQSRACLCGQLFPVSADDSSGVWFCSPRCRAGAALFIARAVTGVSKPQRALVSA